MDKHTRSVVTQGYCDNQQAESCFELDCSAGSCRYTLLTTCKMAIVSEELYEATT